MPKDIKWHELFDATEKALDRFVNDPKRFGHNFLVWMRKRYECDPVWEYSRELLLFEGVSLDGKPQYAWLNDWYEGQEEVEFLAVADLDEDAKPPKEEPVNEITPGITVRGDHGCQDG